MTDVLIWWLVVQILGLAALPVAWRLFSGLPDRGYAFAKPLGIFLVTYLLWILAMFGVVRNNRGTVMFLVLAVAVAAWWWVMRRRGEAGDTAAPQAAARPRRLTTTSGGKKGRHGARQGRDPGETPEILTWVRANIRIIAIEEAIFLVGLLVWALFKAYNPEIIATEKPMEFAFLNGILRSDVFPPLDPWLSGFSISYYYMGYVLMAVLTRLSGVAPSVAFNLTLVLAFSLTMTGAFSIVYNLVARRRTVPVETPPQPPQRTGAHAPSVATGLFAAFLVAIMGNLEGFLEFFYARGIGSAAFWASLGIADLDKPYVSASWFPTSNWWWWKASRVIGTQGPIGDYTINEFPFFSFMLGDNHPHVLALPYALLCVALGLAILLGPLHNLLDSLREQRWTKLLGAWFLPALLLGSLFFLNSWDFPTYTFIVVLAYALRVYREHARLDLDAIKEILLFALPVAVLAVLLFIPFYISFQSQASGFAIVRVRTQLHHFLIIFAPFLIMTLGFLVVKLHEWRALAAEDKREARAYLLPLIAAGVIIAAGMVAIQLWTTVTTLLLTSVGGVLVSLLLLAFVVLALFAFFAHCLGDSSDVFVIVLIGTACGVTLLPEWMHINDTFGGNLSRMNTVFKFLYQGWILFGLASAYSVYRVIADRAAGVRLARSGPRLVYALVVVALVLAGAFYPVMAFVTKANEFKVTPTLDGMAYMKANNADDYYAIQWLNRNISGSPVIVEAIGGEYSEYARISTHTGLPSVLGWPGHEVQWRGNAKGWESREGDVSRLYATTDVNEAKSLLAKYGVTYVYVGRLERETRDSSQKAKYDATALGKFATFMEVAYQQGSVTIYRTRQ